MRATFLYTFLTVAFVLLSLVVLFPSIDGNPAWRNDWLAALIVTAKAVLAMFVLPVFFVRLVLKLPLSDFGWRLPENNRQAFKLIIITLLLLLPVIFFLARQQSIQTYYGIASNATPLIFIVNVPLSFLYYAAEEFLFRGFFFWGLWRKIGYHAFWINAFVFAVFHLTKPAIEVIFAFAAALLFSYLSLKTKSFLTAVVVHFLIALAINALVTYVWSTPIAAAL